MERRTPVRWERFVHRDSDGPLIVGRAAHEAAGLNDVYSRVELAEPPQLLDGFLLRGVAETHGREIWDAHVGELITDQGFLSVTSDLHPEVVQALASLDDAALLQIQPHVGARAIVLNDVLPDSEFAHEMEVVIQRSTTLQIVRKHTSDWMRVVDVVIANQPPELPLMGGSGASAG